MANLVPLAESKQKQPPWLERLRALTGTVNGQPNLPERVTVTPAEVGAIRRQVASLRSELTTGPHETEEKAKAIMMLFAVLGSEPMSPQLAELRQLSYLEAVSKYPAWAVREAARMWRDGERRLAEENRNFVPKPAELLRLVRIVLDPAERNLTGLEKTLAAAERRAGLVEPTPEERARVAAGFADLRASMKAEEPEHERVAAIEQSLRRRLVELGQDPAELDRVPDANLPTGTWSKPSIPRT